MYLHRKLVHKRQQNVHFTKKYILLQETSTDLAPHLLVRDGNISNISKHVVTYPSTWWRDSVSCTPAHPPHKHASLWCVCACACGKLICTWLNLFITVFSQYRCLEQICYHLPPVGGALDLWKLPATQYIFSKMDVLLPFVDQFSM